MSSDKVSAFKLLIRIVGYLSVIRFSRIENKIRRSASEPFWTPISSITRSGMYEKKLIASSSDELEPLRYVSLTPEKISAAR